VAKRRHRPRSSQKTRKLPKWFREYEQATRAQSEACAQAEAGIDNDPGLNLPAFLDRLLRQNEEEGEPHYALFREHVYFCRPKPGWEHLFGDAWEQFELELVAYLDLLRQERHAIKNAQAVLAAHGWEDTEATREGMAVLVAAQESRHAQRAMLHASILDGTIIGAWWDARHDTERGARGVEGGRPPGGVQWYSGAVSWLIQTAMAREPVNGKRDLAYLYGQAANLAEDSDRLLEKLAPTLAALRGVRFGVGPEELIFVEEVATGRRQTITLRMFQDRLQKIAPA
jgi:hypothetical protein